MQILKLKHLLSVVATIFLSNIVGAASQVKVSTQRWAISHPDNFINVAIIRSARWGKLKIQNRPINKIPSNAEFNTLLDGNRSFRKLYIRRCSIKSFPANFFKGLDWIVYLNIQGNELTSLNEDLFAPLTNLRRIYLGSNPLTTLPEKLFKMNVLLTSIYFDETKISTLPANIFRANSDLVKLCLWSNKNMKTFSVGLIDTNDKLKKLWLPDALYETEKEFLRNWWRGKGRLVGRESWTGYGLMFYD